MYDVTKLLVGTGGGLVELVADGAVTRVHLKGRDVDAIAGDARGWWVLVEGAEVWQADQDRAGLEVALGLGLEPEIVEEGAPPTTPDGLEKPEPAVDLPQPAAKRCAVDQIGPPPAVMQAIVEVWRMGAMSR